MLNAEAKQFKLDAEGQVLFQANATNPLPGQPVARLSKGQGLLNPDITVLDTNLLDGQDKLAIGEKLKEWARAHIATVLEPLTLLNNEEGIEGTARGIAFQLYEAMGIVPRIGLEDLIAGLDDAGRASLRQRKVRLGPVLVFLPALNKPASVRLRALLWSLWHGRDLPAKIPHDGTTSVTIDPAEIDPVYYRAIGYPVYGPRAIRVDMLDRLISAVYDGAKDGKFQATHSMAEWLGCSIPVLYEVLEAMGHTKQHDPAATAVAAKLADVEAEAAMATESPAEVPAAEAAPATAVEVAAETVAKAPVVAARPELATFRLRRGKAYDKPRVPRPAYAERKPPVERTLSPDRPAFKRDDRKDKKPEGGDAPRHGKPRDDKARRDDSHRKDARSRDGFKKGGRDRDDRPDRPEKVISARPDTQGESPFAALQGLKLKKDGK